MAAVPPWLRGRSVSGIVITGMTAGTDGTLTDATGTGIQTLTTIWEEIDFESNPILEEISSSNASRSNNVLIQENNRVRVSIPMESGLRSGAGANDLANPLGIMAANYDYLKLVFVRGGKTYTFLGLRESYRENLRKGKNVHELTLAMIDPGAANPTFA